MKSGDISGLNGLLSPIPAETEKASCALYILTCVSAHTLTPSHLGAVGIGERQGVGKEERLTLGAEGQPGGERHQGN